MWTRGVERALAEGQRREIGDGVQAGVVPAGIAHRQIHPAVALAAEVLAVLAFAGAGIEHARARRQGSRRSRATASRIRTSKCRTWRRSEARQPVCEGRCSSRFLARLDHHVDPARQAASASVNGIEPTTRSRNRRDPSAAAGYRASGSCRTRRAMGSSTGPGWWPAPRDCRAAKSTCGATLRSRSSPAAPPDRGRGNR